MMKNTKYKNIKIKKVSGAIGALIEDVQLGENLAENTSNEIYDAFLKHQVIFLETKILHQKVYYLLLKELVHLLFIHLSKD